MPGKIPRKRGQTRGFSETGYYKSPVLARAASRSLVRRLEKLEIERDELLSRAYDDPIAEERLKRVLKDMAFANSEIARIKSGKGPVPRLEVD